MAVTVEQAIHGSTASGTSVTLTSWTPAADELILVGVALRNETITPSVSGNGLTFESVGTVDNARGQNGIKLFRAMGTPTAGSITVSLPGNSSPAVVVAVRFSGVDTSGTNGSGAVEAVVLEPSTSTDNNDMKTTITTLTNDALVVGFGTHRNRTFTVPSSQTAIDINVMDGSGGDITSESVWSLAVPSAGSVVIGGDNDLSADTAWCMIAVSVKPVSSTPEPDLVILSSEPVDFGTVVVGLTNTYTFDFGNAGTADLTITSISIATNTPDGEYSLVLGPITFPLVLAPGVNRDFEINIQAVNPGVKAGVLRIESDDPAEPIRDVQLTANAVYPEISHDSPNPYDFGSVIVGDAPLTHDVTINRVYNVQTYGNVEIVGGDGNFSVSPSSYFIDDGSPSPDIVTVTFSPATAGDKTATLRIHISNNPVTPYVDIALSGRGETKNLFDTSLDFGTVVVGSTENKTAIIPSTGTLPVTVTGVTMPPVPELVLVSSYSFPVVVNPGETFNIQLAWTPTADGQTLFGNSVIINTDEPSGSTQLSLSGTATTQIISVDPSVGQFGAIPLREKATLTLTFTVDPGYGSVYIQSYGLENNAYAEFSVESVSETFPRYVSGFTATVSCLPLFSGPKTAWFEVVYTAGSTYTLRVPLQATGESATNWYNHSGAICDAIVNALNANVSDAEFRCVRSFPENDTIKTPQWRMGLLRLQGSDNYFVQDRIYTYLLRLYMPEYRDDISEYTAFIEEVREVLRANLAIAGTYEGLNIGKTRIFEEFEDGAFCEMELEVLAVEDRRITLYGKELKQQIFTQGVEDCILTAELIQGGTYDLELLKDRSVATKGLNGVIYALYTIEFPEAREIDYLLFGGFELSASAPDHPVKEWLLLEYWDGTQWNNLFPDNDIPPERIEGEAYNYIMLWDVPFTAEKIRVEMEYGGTLAYLLTGKSYTFPKTYDLKDVSYGINVSNIMVQTTQDNSIGYPQKVIVGTELKDYWSVTYGLRQTDFDALMPYLETVNVNQLPFGLLDTYRSDRVKLVRLQDGILRVTQHFEDYIRLNLRIQEE